MVDPVEFKQHLSKQISQECTIEFLGKNFDKIVALLSESKIKKIYSWVDDVLLKKSQPISMGSDKSYKEWKIHDLLIFRYPFSIGKTAYKILFVKIKNSIYIEFHLGDHNYYDKVRKELDLKKK